MNTGGTINTDSDIIYLNHAAVAPWPQVSVDAVKAFAEENGKYGAKNYLQWFEKENQLRINLQSLINAPSVDDIALLKSTSEALSFVAYGIDWDPGDNIIIFEQEFPSNRIVWESLRKHGVQVQKVNLYQENPEIALLDKINHRTRLISVSSIQYARGLRIDLKMISSACRDNDIYFCVDAIQSLGVFPIDVQALDIDFLAADGHKWLMGPEGLALFYTSNKIRQKLQLTEYGWHMLENANNFDEQNWSITNTGKRFECGSPNMLATMALLASTDLILKFGVSEISQSVLSNCQYLINALQNIPDIELLSTQQPSRLSGIVCFEHKQVSSELLYKCLMQHNVICAARGGGVRFSPHFYQDHALMQRGIDILSHCIKKINK